MFVVSESKKLKPCAGIWACQRICLGLANRQTVWGCSEHVNKPSNFDVSLRSYSQWIGLLVKILTGNPWFLPSNWSGVPVQIFPSSNSMILNSHLPSISPEALKESSGGDWGHRGSRPEIWQPVRAGGKIWGTYGEWMKMDGTLEKSISGHSRSKLSK